MIAFIHADLSYDWAHVRHFLAWAFNIQNWMTNGSEQLIAILIGAAITYLLWPKLHKAVDEWMKRHAHAANAELHAKLDHIIKHHPDIPPMSTKRAAPRVLKKDSGAS